MLTLPDVAKMAVQRVQADKDLVLAVTGDEGCGKSTLGKGLGIEIGKEAGVGFDMENNVLYSPTVKELEDKIRLLPKYSAIDADEAIKILYKLNWQSKGQKYINQLYATCRKENKITELLIPRFYDLNDFFRNHRVKIWIHVIDEVSKEKSVGHAALFVKSWSPFASDPWWLKDAQKAIDRYSTSRKLREVDYDLHEKMGVLEKAKNFVDIVEFGWIDSLLWAKYLELKDKYAYKEETLSVDEQNMRLVKLREENVKLMALLQTQGVTQKAIGDKLGVTLQAVHNRLATLKKFD